MKSISKDSKDYTDLFALLKGCIGDARYMYDIKLNSTQKVVPLILSKAKESFFSMLKDIFRLEGIEKFYMFSLFGDYAVVDGKPIHIFSQHGEQIEPFMKSILKIESEDIYSEYITELSDFQYGFAQSFLFCSDKTSLFILDDDYFNAIFVFIDFSKHNPDIYTSLLNHIMLTETDFLELVLNKDYISTEHIANFKKNILPNMIFKE